MIPTHWTHLAAASWLIAALVLAWRSRRLAWRDRSLALLPLLAAAALLPYTLVVDTTSSQPRPRDLAVLLDDSGSMRGLDEGEQDRLTPLADQLATLPLLAEAPRSGLGIPPQAGSPLGDALVDASRGTDEWLLFVTDGLSNRGLDVEQAALRCRERGMRVAVLTPDDALAPTGQLDITTPASIPARRESTLDGLAWLPGDATVGQLRWQVDDEPATLIELADTGWHPFRLTLPAREPGTLQLTLALGVGGEVHASERLYLPVQEQPTVWLVLSDRLDWECRFLLRALGTLPEHRLILMLSDADAAPLEAGGVRVDGLILHGEPSIEHLRQALAAATPGGPRLLLGGRIVTRVQQDPELTLQLLPDPRGAVVHEPGGARPFTLDPVKLAPEAAILGELLDAPGEPLEMPSLTGRLRLPPSPELFLLVPDGNGEPLVALGTHHPRALVAADDLWRWGFHADERVVATHARLLTALVETLTTAAVSGQGSPLELQLLEREPTVGEPLVAIAQHGLGQLALRLYGPDDRLVARQLGEQGSARLTAIPTTPGLHRLEANDGRQRVEHSFEVQAIIRERQGEVDGDWIQALVEGTDGRRVTPGELSGSPDWAWRAVEQHHQHPWRRGLPAAVVLAALLLAVSWFGLRRFLSRLQP